jgi:hypothetical protein
MKLVWGTIAVILILLATAGLLYLTNTGFVTLRKPYIYRYSAEHLAVGKPELFTSHGFDQVGQVVPEPDHLLAQCLDLLGVIGLPLRKKCVGQDAFLVEQGLECLCCTMTCLGL